MERIGYLYLRAIKEGRKMLFLEFTEKHALEIYEILSDADFLIEKIDRDTFNERSETLSRHRVPDSFAITILPSMGMSLLNNAIDSNGLTQRWINSNNEY